MFTNGEPVRIVGMKQAKRIRAIVADLDNTLVNQFGDISRNNAAILRQMNEEGVIVGLATGRKANESSKLLDFWRLGHAVSFIVGSNGCDYINLRTRRHIQENYLTEKTCVYSVKNSKEKQRDGESDITIAFIATK